MTSGQTNGRWGRRSFVEPVGDDGAHRAGRKSVTAFFNE